MQMRYLDPEIDFSFPIVKISVKITLVRILLLILTFVPLFLIENVPVTYQNHLGILSGVFLVLFFIFTKFISNYKNVGFLDFYIDYFKISIGKENLKTTNNSVVKINYNGFKDDVQYRKFTRQGVNEIHIEQHNSKFEYKFLSTGERDLTLLSKFKARFLGKMTIDVSGEEIL